MISLIACVGKNRELGKDNDLVFRLKSDLRFFASITCGHIIVMGHNTWDSLPRRLNNRLNLVVSSSEVDGADGTIKDLDTFLKFHQNSSESVFVIGGASLYEQAMPYASVMYLTEVDASATADTFFPTFSTATWKNIVLKTGKERDYNYTIKQYYK